MMQPSNVKFSFYMTVLVVLGMFGIFVADVTLQGYMQTNAVLFSLSLISFGLIGNLVNNHAQVMESAAPGARLYQRLTLTIQETVLTRHITAKHKAS